MQCCVQEYWSIGFNISKQEIIAMASDALCGMIICGIFSNCNKLMDWCNNQTETIVFWYSTLQQPATTPADKQEHYESIS